MNAAAASREPRTSHSTTGDADSFREGTAPHHLIASPTHQQTNQPNPIREREYVAVRSRVLHR